MSKNTITSEHVEAMLDAAETQIAVLWGKETLLSFKLRSGFTVTGRSACVDPDNFDPDLGRKYAREDAKKQLWAFEGYRLQCDLHTRGQL